MTDEDLTGVWLPRDALNTLLCVKPIGKIAQLSCEGIIGFQTISQLFENLTIGLVMDCQQNVFGHGCHH